MPSSHVSPHRRQRRKPVVSKFGLPSAAVIAFTVFMLVVALTGGSALPHIGWLLMLRPMSVLCIVAILLAGPIDWRGIRPLLVLLTLFAATVAIQLVPLPPSFWYGLGGRTSYDRVAQILDGTDLWHPIAISPDRAWNSLIALLTPLGVLAGFASLTDRQRHLLLWPLLGLIAFSMIVGVAQIASGTTSPLYWYRPSGRGQMIGLFANRNHQGALLALTLPLLRAWTLLPTARRQTARTRNVISLSVGAVIVLYILVLGSRAGFALMFVGLIAAFFVAPFTGFHKLSRRNRWLITGGVTAGFIAVVAIALSADRAASISRVFDDDLGTEGRLAALPTLRTIITHTLPLGTGFGSFVPVYQTYEPDALLKTSYFNNAHNDLLELIITGGLPALFVFILFMIWWLRASWRVFSAKSSHSWQALQRAAAFGILLLLLASLTDYPLRTPLMGAVFTILCCWLAYTPVADSHSPKNA